MERREDKHAAVREPQTKAQSNNPDAPRTLLSTPEPELRNFSALWQRSLAGEGARGQWEVTKSTQRKCQMWHGWTPF